MKTALHDPLLMCNLNSECNIDEFILLLTSLDIKYQLKKTEPKDANPGQKGADGLPLKMTKGYTEIKFRHKIYFIDVPYLAIGQKGIQSVRYTRISTKFDESNIVIKQAIFIETENTPTGAYEIIEPFLYSSDWETVQRKSSSTFSSFRNDNILLQNIDKQLLAWYNESNAIVFQPLKFIKFYE